MSVLNFGSYRLYALEVLFSRGPTSAEDVAEGGLCPPIAHQHLRMTFTTDDGPDIGIHAVGNPDDGSEWTIHPETKAVNVQFALEYALRGLGTNAEVLVMSPDQLPPGMLPPGPQPKAADTEDDDDLPGFYL